MQQRRLDADSSARLKKIIDNLTTATQTVLEWGAIRKPLWHDFFITFIWKAR